MYGREAPKRPKNTHFRGFSANFDVLDFLEKQPKSGEKSQFGRLKWRARIDICGVCTHVRGVCRVERIQYKRPKLQLTAQELWRWLDWWLVVEKSQHQMGCQSSSCSSAHRLCSSSRFGCWIAGRPITTNPTSTADQQLLEGQNSWQSVYRLGDYRGPSSLPSVPFPPSSHSFILNSFDLKGNVRLYTRGKSRRSPPKTHKRPTNQPSPLSGNSRLFSYVFQLETGHTKTGIASGRWPGGPFFPAANARYLPAKRPLSRFVSASICGLARHLI